MNCSKILNMIYEGQMPLLNQVQVWFHTLFCQNCASKIEQLEKAHDILCEDFFPVSPDFENSIMARIQAEEQEFEAAENYAPKSGFSTRTWIIAGLLIFISLATAYFGFDFKSIIKESGTSFLLPMGITIGTVLTVYGAFFIGSHLKELTERFGL